MGKLKIRTFKRWFQVVHNGYTVAQFLSRHEAEDYVRQEGGRTASPAWESATRRHTTAEATARCGASRYILSIIKKTKQWK